MNLYILRHGKAEPLGPAYPRDDERPLSPGGWRRTERSAKGMAAANVAVGAIISSPLLRARQTAEIVHLGLGVAADIEYSDALATGDLMGILSAVRSHERSKGVMLVGHEPTLSHLISMALAIRRACGGALDLKPGGLCKLQTYGSVAIGLRQCAMVRWFLTPKQLVGLGRRSPAGNRGAAA